MAEFATIDADGGNRVVLAGTAERAAAVAAGCDAVEFAAASERFLYYRADGRIVSVREMCGDELAGEDHVGFCRGGVDGVAADKCLIWRDGRNVVGHCSGCGFDINRDDWA